MLLGMLLSTPLLLFIIIFLINGKFLKSLFITTGITILLSSIFLGLLVSQANALKTNIQTKESLIIFSYEGKTIGTVKVDPTVEKTDMQDKITFGSEKLLQRIDSDMLNDYENLLQDHAIIISVETQNLVEDLPSTIDLAEFDLQKQEIEEILESKNASNELASILLENQMEDNPQIEQTLSEDQKDMLEKNMKQQIVSQLKKETPLQNDNQVKTLISFMLLSNTMMEGNNLHTSGLLDQLNNENIQIHSNSDLLFFLIKNMPIEQITSMVENKT